jgi:hypothetical protein
MSDEDCAFLEHHHSAAMITAEDDGPRAVRVAIALVDGRLWRSGTADRRRTDRLRGDPRCTLFVFEQSWQWLTLETRVDILDGTDAAEKNLQFFRTLQNAPSGMLSWFGRELPEDDFLEVMRNENRLIYDFDVVRSYGMFSNDA